MSFPRDEPGSPRSEANASTTRSPSLEDRLSVPGRRSWLFLLVALLLAMQVKGWWIPGQDALAYLSIARNLSDGEWAFLGSPHLRYGPGYSILIAPAFMVDDRPFMTIALMHLVLGMLLMIGIRTWARAVLAERDAGIATAASALVTALVMLNAGFWHYYQETLSELAFVTEIVWGAVALRGVMAATTVRRALACGAGAVVLLSIAAVTRQLGVFLVGGFGLAVLVMMVRRRMGWLRGVTSIMLVGFPVTAVALGLILWDHGRADASADTRGYLAYLTSESMSFGAQVLESVRLRISEVGRLLVPGMLRAYADDFQWLHINTIIYGGVSITIAAGWWRLARAVADPLLYMFPLYTLFLMTWPYDQGVRYMMPMLPVLALSLWALLERWPRHRLSVLFILAVVHGAVSIGDWTRSWRIARFHEHWSEIDTLAAAIDEVGAGVALQGLHRNLGLMLSLEIDAPVRVLEDPGADIDETWLVVPRDDPPGPGFTLHTESATMELHRRVDPVAS